MACPQCLVIELTTSRGRPRFVIDYDRPYSTETGVQQIHINFVKVGSTWSACTDQTPILLDELSSWKSSEGLDPQIRAIDMVVPVHHDLDSFWRMQLMELSLDKDYLERYSHLTSTYTPAKVMMQEVD